MDAVELTAALKEKAFRLGFDLVGAVPAVAAPDFERFCRWLDTGCPVGLKYLAERRQTYQHPEKLLAGAKSLLMLGMNYRTVEPIEPGEGQGRVSRYAWGLDYHEVIRKKLDELSIFLRQLVPSAGVRGVVDTAPLLERQFARLAGLGYIGKNNLLIHPRFGSWIFLAALLTTEVLVYDKPLEGDICGECRACLDACPTGALVGERCLDAGKCLSYLLIESEAAELPEDVGARQGRWIFGCDVCQNVCPWNRHTPATGNEAFRPLAGMNPVNLDELASLDEEGFRRRFRHTPLWRAKRAGILRNIRSIWSG